MESMTQLFTGIGLDIKKAKETCANAKLSVVLKDLIYKAQLDKGIADKDKNFGTLLYILATRVAHDMVRHQDTILTYLIARRITTSAQLDAAFEYLAKRESITDVAEFESYSGIGVTVKPEQITEAVKTVIEANKADILEERYHTNTGHLLGKVREIHKWADVKLIKEEIDIRLSDLLGPRTAADDEPKQKKKDKGKVKLSDNAATTKSPTSTNGAATGESSNSAAESDGNVAARLFEGEVLKFHKPGENPQIKPELMQAHLAATGGKVMTRFPPEPNGFLHIGHAKAMNFNFRYSEIHNGHCYLRFDDTNPEAEDQFYFDSITECVKWLGFTPYKITATSDYFDTLYEYAIRMIKNGKAFVCHQTAEEMHAARGGENMGPRTESPWRNRPVEETLTEFEKMRTGHYKPGEATLRMKMDMTSGNPYMWDPVAYRVLNKAHVRTGDKWIIYPTYDFSHCLTDSIENITHSLCTTEFKLARESYYWVCDAVEVYKPVQWEYGRLNITNTVLSKRKIIKLVETKTVRGWDDPRLYTLLALRRRGFPPKAINTFAEKLGITTSLTVVSVDLLEACVRDELNLTATRCKVVLDPIKVTITNFPEDRVDERAQPKNPIDVSKGETRVPFCNTIYIDRSDFREKDEPDYYRLAPGKEVGLARAYNITCNKMIYGPDGRVAELLCTYDPSNTRKPKAYIHWVAHTPMHKSPVPAEVRLYSSLFKSANPDAVEGGFMKDINPNSLKVIEHALCDITVANAKPGDVFQFERVGYFCVDPDSTPDNLVFNLTVSLKEDAKKK